MPTPHCQYNPQVLHPTSCSLMVLGFIIVVVLCLYAHSLHVAHMASQNSFWSFIGSCNQSNAPGFFATMGLMISDVVNFVSYNLMGYLPIGYMLPACLGIRIAQYLQAWLTNAHYYPPMWNQSLPHASLHPMSMPRPPGLWHHPRYQQQQIQPFQQWYDEPRNFNPPLMHNFPYHQM